MSPAWSTWCRGQRQRRGPEAAAVKVLWPAIMNTEDQRARGQPPTTERTDGPARLIKVRGRSAGASAHRAPDLLLAACPMIVRHVYWTMTMKSFRMATPFPDLGQVAPGRHSQSDFDRCSPDVIWQRAARRHEACAGRSPVRVRFEQHPRPRADVPASCLTAHSSRVISPRRTTHADSKWSARCLRSEAAPRASLDAQDRCLNHATGDSAGSRNREAGDLRIVKACNGYADLAAGLMTAHLRGTVHAVVTLRAFSEAQPWNGLGRGH